MIYNLIEKCRSYRRFDEDKKISKDVLVSFVKGARLTASAANLQKLRYSLFTEENKCGRIFEGLKFAGYLTDWKGPEAGERPVAYIVICSNSELNLLTAIDLGIVSEAISLSAAEKGIGSCMFRSFCKETLTELVGKEGMIPHLVIAFGYPSETVLLKEAEDGNIRYYRDSDDRHIVPKLPLDSVII